MTRFTEASLEEAVIELLEGQGYPYHKGSSLDRQPTEVLIKEDLHAFLSNKYAKEGITEEEKMTDLTKTLYQQMKESEKLDAVIRKNLEVLDYGE